MRGNGQARPHGYGVICCRCWVLLRVPVGKIMAPFAPVLVPLLRVEGQITLTDTQADLLAQTLAATIDRMLAGERSRTTCDRSMGRGGRARPG